MKLFKWIYKYLTEFKKIVKYGNKDKPSEIDEYGTKYWYNDKRQFHREDSPAIEWLDGDKEWWINGKCIDISIFLKKAQ